MKAPPRIFMTAAELSADRHQANLGKALKALRPEIVLEGVGGTSMVQAGVEVHHETVRQARFGIGALLRAAEVIGILRWTRRYFKEKGPPGLMVCCDSWMMNKHFLAIAREFGVPTLYYISPQVWASREGRVRKMRRLIDEMAVILPFEEHWLTERGIVATFVGHPLFDGLPADPPRFEPQEHFPNRDPLIALIPGSRRGIAARNLPRLLEVARRIAAAFPAAKFVIPSVEATANCIESFTSRHFATWRAEGRLQTGDDFDAIVAPADLAVCVSGTATLHAAALGVPLVSVFMAPRLGWKLLGQWIVKTRTFALVNWLHPQRKHVVREFIPWFGEAEPVADHVIDWLKHPEKLTEQRAAQAAVVDPLRKKGASENAARVALRMLKQSA